MLTLIILAATVAKNKSLLACLEKTRAKNLRSLSEYLVRQQYRKSILSSLNTDLLEHLYRGNRRQRFRGRRLKWTYTDTL
jgi:hypothetical protein